jgi:hypothetical protein
MLCIRNHCNSLKKLWLFDMVQGINRLNYDRSDSHDLYVRVDAYELGTLFLLSNYFIGLSLQILISKSFPMLVTALDCS